MKHCFLIWLGLFFFPAFSFSQETSFVKGLSASMIDSAVIDSTDMAIYHWSEVFFMNNFQNDVQIINPKTRAMIDSLIKDPHAKNMHLIGLLMFSYEIIGNTIPPPNEHTAYQVEINEEITKQFKNTYNRIPVLIYTFLAESYINNEQFDSLNKILPEARKQYPDAIPLKVYQYQQSKDPQLKEDLLKNHANHWLVKSYHIQK